MAKENKNTTTVVPYKRPNMAVRDTARRRASGLLRHRVELGEATLDQNTREYTKAYRESSGQKPKRWFEYAASGVAENIARIGRDLARKKPR